MISRSTLLIALIAFFAGVSIDLHAQTKPLKVFVLVGQSNMQGHAHVRTFPHLGMDPDFKPLFDSIIDENTSKPTVHSDVWVSFLSSNGIKTGPLTTGFGANEEKIGPELTFGIYMQQRLGEPILIIKAAWGGKSIHTDFRQTFETKPGHSRLYTWRENPRWAHSRLEPGTDRSARLDLWEQT